MRCEGVWRWGVAEPAKRIRPGQGPDGKINGGAISPIEGLPPDVDLLDEYEEGKQQIPRVTMEAMAEKYGVSSSLIHRKINRARLLAKQLQTEEQQTDLDRELRFTKSAVELFRQIEENCGREAMRRVLGMVHLQMGLIDPYREDAT